MFTPRLCKWSKTTDHPGTTDNSRTQFLVHISVKLSHPPLTVLPYPKPPISRFYPTSPYDFHPRSLSPRDHQPVFNVWADVLWTELRCSMSTNRDELGISQIARWRRQSLRDRIAPTVFATSLRTSSLRVKPKASVEAVRAELSPNPSPNSSRFKWKTRSRNRERTSSHSETRKTRTTARLFWKQVDTWDP